jgi:NitT/TauT family transport system substrate-binding protein
MDKIAVGLSSNNYFNLPFWVAQHEGFFAAEDLEVTGMRYEAEAQNVSWLEEGTTQYTFINTETAITGGDEGKPYLMIGGNVQRLPFRLIAASGISSASDLRGKTIGVSSLGVGTSTLLRDYLAGFGLEYQKDYTMIAAGMIRRRWEMLESGEIDAGMQGTPMEFVAVDAGYSDLGDITHDIGQYQFVALGVLRPFAAANQDLTVRFLRALAGSHAWFYANRDGATAIAMQETGISREYGYRAWDRYSGEQVFPVDGDVSIEGIETVLHISGKVRELDSRLTAHWQDYVDRSYFLEAMASLRTQTTP